MTLPQITNKVGCFSSFSTMTGRQSKLLILPAIFRLVATCEVKQNEGSLEGIDALLGEWNISEVFSLNL